MSTAFPPHQSIPSIPIPQERALEILQAFLTSSQSTPYLLPNAKLEPTGPSTGSSNSSVTMHNLGRLEAGLRGEWLAPVLELEEGKDKEAEKKPTKGDNMEVDDWQDPEEYQLEQDIEEGDLGATLAVEQNSDLEIEEAENIPEVAAPKPLTEEEKAARKKEKKQRNQASKKSAKASK